MRRLFANEHHSASTGASLATFVGSCAFSITLLAMTPPARSQQLEQTIIEYYNTHLDHYFLATRSDAEFIDAGKAGQGWQQTGHFFRTSILFGESMCRFYGSFEIGPNSHFLTNNALECQFLKDLQPITPDSQPRWNFEGISFRAGIPVDGQCGGVYQRPVHRFYNRGSARGIDSNHRYVVAEAALLETYGKGWIYEGIAFCVL